LADNDEIDTFIATYEVRQEFAKQHDAREREKSNSNSSTVPKYSREVNLKSDQTVTSATKLVEDIEKRKTLFNKKVSIFIMDLGDCNLVSTGCVILMG
jgi:hypothetical protein